MEDLPALPQALRKCLDTMPQSLHEHTDRVMEIAVDLAGVHGADVDRTLLAAAGHDVSRADSPDEWFRAAYEYGVTVGRAEILVPVLLHGPVGAEWLRRHADIADPDVLDAVRWHTTGTGDMSTVAKIVFLADKLDPAKYRRYHFQTDVSELATVDLDAALLFFVSKEVQRLLRRRPPQAVHSEMLNFYNSLLTTT